MNWLQKYGSFAKGGKGNRFLSTARTGTWRVNGSFNESESINTLHKAIDLGVHFFDTADMYGSGANEKLIGKAFKDRWDEVVLATKFQFYIQMQ